MEVIWQVSDAEEVVCELVILKLNLAKPQERPFWEMKSDKLFCNPPRPPTHSMSIIPSLTQMIKGGGWIMFINSEWQ